MERRPAGRGVFLGEGEWQAEFIGLPDTGSARPTGAACATSSTWRRDLRPRHPVRHGAGRLPGRSQRNGRSTTSCSSPAGRRTSTGWSTRPPTSPTCCTPDATRSASPWPAAGTPRASASRARRKPFYGTQPSFAGQAAARVRRRHAPSGSPPAPTGRPPATAHGRPAGIYAGESYDARLVPAGWSQPGFASIRLGRGQPGHCRPGPRSPHRTRGARDPARCPSPRCSPRRQVRPCSTSARTWSGACASASAARPATTITLRHAEVLEDGELGVRPLRVAKATDSYTLAGGRRGGVGAQLHLPRLPLRRGRRLARRARPGRRHRGGHPLRHGAHRLVRVLRPAGQPAARERGVGHARQLPLPAHRLPAARRAPGLDRRHPGVQPHRVASSTTATASSRPGWSTWRSSSRPPAASRSSSPTCSTRPRCPAAAWGDAAVVLPWVLYQRFGDLGILAAQYPSHEGLGRPAARRSPARATCGRAASSSATGSTPTRRRTTRPRPRPTPTWSPAPTCSARPTCSPGRPPRARQTG